MISSRKRFGILEFSLVCLTCHHSFIDRPSNVNYVTKRFCPFPQPEILGMSSLVESGLVCSVFLLCFLTILFLEFSFISVLPLLRRSYPCTAGRLLEI